jgi:hypothetical protein
MVFMSIASPRYFSVFPPLPGLLFNEVRANAVPNTYQLPSTRIASHYTGICDDSRSLDEIKGNPANAKILESFRETRRGVSNSLRFHEGTLAARGMVWFDRRIGVRRRGAPI